MELAQVRVQCLEVLKLGFGYQRGHLVNRGFYVLGKQVMIFRSESQNFVLTYFRVDFYLKIFFC
jgi:hypothetical protein